jgi:hypothetical protein
MNYLHLLPCSCKRAMLKSPFLLPPLLLFFQLPAFLFKAHLSAAQGVALSKEFPDFRIDLQKCF